jgi:hypothetical protein
VAAQILTVVLTEEEAEMVDVEEARAHTLAVALGHSVGEALELDEYALARFMENAIQVLEAKIQNIYSSVE